jgi:hypothetical protein
MNTPTDRERALELALAARREPLPESDRAWLDRQLAASADLRREVCETEKLLDRLAEARIEPGEAFQARLVAHLDSLVQAEALAPCREPRGAGSGVLRRCFGFLFGRERTQGGPSWGTLLLARSLAVYMGIAVAFCLYLAAREPTEAARPEGFPDRTAVEEIVPGPGSAPR